MNKYIIGTLLVIILALSSYIYKDRNLKKNQSLSPSLRIEFSSEDKNPRMYLFVFFSKKNCRDCLEIIDVLNELPSSYFVVRGIVPDSELKKINEIRWVTGAAFPIDGQSKFKNFKPVYTPSIVGASRKGEVFFVLAGVPGEKEYLSKFLDSIYNKLYNYLLSN